MRLFGTKAWAGRCGGVSARSRLVGLVALTSMVASGLVASAPGPASAHADFLALDATKYGVAFQGSTPVLVLRNPDGSRRSVGIRMALGTSPSVADLDGCHFLAAFQGSNGNLWTVASDGDPRDTGLRMAPGTSPSIDDNVDIAFQGSDGTLWLSTQGVGRSLALDMAPNTSPSVTRTSGRAGSIIAFQGRTGTLRWTFPRVPSLSRDTGLRMAPGTSPTNEDLGRGSTSGVVMAFHGSTGTLWTVTSRDGDPGRDTRLGMAPGTSPGLSLATVFNPGDTTEIAFHGSTGTLWTVTPTPLGDTAQNTGLAIMAGTSPDRSDPHDGAGEHVGGGIAFQDGSGLLWIVTPDGVPHNTMLGMQRNSSPAIMTAPCGLAG